MTPSYLNLVLFSALDPKEALAKAKAAAQKALELDETLADAHNALAGVRRYEWDWSGAESEYKRAIDLDPNNAGAHSNYAVHLLDAGRLTEALAEIRRAEELDPLTIYLKLNKEAALGSLERAYSAHDPQMQYLKVLPHYDPLRSDPRFTDLQRRVGLTP